ncbi:MAG: factor-independent urate hydroxylase [Solirubrobacterales bacterium]
MKAASAVRADGTVAEVDYQISYGKASVPVYRQYAARLGGLPEIPESPLRGRDNALFANEVTVEVFGDNFLPSYTHGDNSNVVATDSMKNFILRQGREFDGATLEGFLDHLGNGFLAKYEQMRGIRMSGVEIPFSVPVVPDGEAFVLSGVVRQRQWSDRSTASLRYQRDGDGGEIVEHSCGRVGMELLKTKGSAFTRFVRDEYTTLPDRQDRPLFIGLDLHWQYAEPIDAVGGDASVYVAGEQVRDVCVAVFDEFVSESIQELLHEMGKRLLERYPQVAAVELIGRNQTRDPYAVPDDASDDRKVFVPPFPAFGTIELKMTRTG